MHEETFYRSTSGSHEAYLPTLTSPYATSTPNRCSSKTKLFYGGTYFCALGDLSYFYLKDMQFLVCVGSIKCTDSTGNNLYSYN
jgi:hypothetical protein